jgi:ribosomal protein L21E
MKYKVGDTVIIRKDLNISMDLVVIPMLKYRGRIAKVIETDLPYYTLCVDTGTWLWHQDTLERWDDIEV